MATRTLSSGVVVLRWHNDHYRYLWDGGVLANGVNPYKYSPFNVQFGQPHPIPDTLHRPAVHGAERRYGQR